MKTLRTVFAVLLGVAAIVVAGAAVESVNPQLSQYMPQDEPLPRGQFVLQHDGRTRQARWVIEHLDRDALRANVERDDAFRGDPDVSEEFRAALSDYRGSGFDRGHLAPSADHRLSEADQRATFVLSNMSPQRPGFNRAIWRKLESHVRELANQPGVDMYVVTAPLWIPGDDGTITVETIGENGVWVPTHCGKAVLIHDGSNPELRAWILPNESSDDPLSAFRVSTDEFERRAGIDVWAALPDDWESQLESTR